jgi:hypothetical protein
MLVQQTLNNETSLDMSLLQAIQQGVQEINSKVVNLDHKIDLQNVKLFGSEDSETPGGRLIRLESELAVTQKKVDDLDTKTTRNSILISVFSAGIAVAFTLIGQWVSHVHI